MKFSLFSCCCSSSVLNQVVDCHGPIAEIPPTKDELQARMLETLNGRGTQTGGTVWNVSEKEAFFLKSPEKEAAVAFLKGGTLGKELNRMDLSINLDNPEVDRMNQAKRKYFTYSKLAGELKNAMSQAASKCEEYGTLKSSGEGVASLRLPELERQIKQLFTEEVTSKLEKIVNLLEENNPPDESDHEQLQRNVEDLGLLLTLLESAEDISLNQIEEHLGSLSSEALSDMFNHFDSTLHNDLTDTCCAAIYEVLSSSLRGDPETVLLDDVCIDDLSASLGSIPHDKAPMTSREISELNVKMALAEISEHSMDCLGLPFMEAQMLLPEGLHATSGASGDMEHIKVGGKLCQEVVYQMKDEELIVNINKFFPVLQPDTGEEFGHLNINVEWNLNRNEYTYNYGYEVLAGE